MITTRVTKTDAVKAKEKMSDYEKEIASKINELYGSIDGAGLLILSVQFGHITKKGATKSIYKNTGRCLYTSWKGEKMDQEGLLFPKAKSKKKKG